MPLATTFLAAALVVPSIPPPEFDDYEVITNCVFDASRQDAKEFAVRIELDATPSNGVEVVFGRDADGDGILSRTEEAMAVGYDCGEWKVVNLVTGDKFTCDGASGRAALDWKLRLNALVFKPVSRCTHQRRAASVTRQNVYVCCCGGIMMML